MIKDLLLFKDLKVRKFCKKFSQALTSLKFHLCHTSSLLSKIKNTLSPDRDTLEKMDSKLLEQETK